MHESASDFKTVPIETRNRLPFNVRLQIRPNGQRGRRDFQGGSVVVTLEVGCEEERRAVDFGKGVRCVDDGVAEAVQDGAVERGEDRVLEYDVLDPVFLACGVGISRRGKRGGRIGLLRCVVLYGWMRGIMMYLAIRAWRSEPRARRMSFRTRRSCCRGRDRCIV